MAPPAPSAAVCRQPDAPSLVFQTDSKQDAPRETAREGALEAQLRDRHWSMLWLSAAVLAASLILQPGGGTSLEVRGLELPLPPLCGSRTLWGIDCAGCGLSRSFVALARGDLQASLAYHRLGWLMAAVVAAQIPYRTYTLWELRSRVVRRSWPKWFGYALIGALLTNWLLP